MSTTIEVLAPYLPYGIECEFTHRPEPYGQSITERQLLAGLATPESTLFDKGLTLDAEDCLPVLFAFEDLCTPLADGTVPAVEAARFILPDDVELSDATAYYDEDERHGDHSIHITGKDAETGEDVRLTIYMDWSADQITYNPAGYIGYLCRHHFAVGLSPEQFIRKTV